MNRRNDLDVIRTMAIFGVIVSHALGAGLVFHMINPPLVQLIVVATNKIAVFCVPFFIMLTGFLNYKKTDYKEFYKKQLPIVATYFFWTIIVIIYNFTIKLMPYTLHNIVSFFLGYGSQDRVWYMNMYFGLVLIVPFFNRMWNSIDKSGKRVCILVLFILGSLVNTVQLTLGHYGYNVIFVSNSFMDLWPLLYYSIGAYICEYSKDLEKKRVAKVFGLLLGAQVVIYLFNSLEEPLAYLWFQASYHYMSPLCVMLSAMAFYMLIGIQIKNNHISRWVMVISKVSFDMYLVSIITDETMYKLLNMSEVSNIAMAKVFLSSVLSFALAFVLAYIKNKLWDRNNGIKRVSR